MQGNCSKCEDSFTILAVRTIRLALGLLILSGLVAGIGPAWEATQRAPEQSVRAYLTAVERDDVSAALALIAPEARRVLRERIETQLGNHYRVDLVALARPSLLARALGAPDTTAAATILAEVATPSGDRWKTTSVVRLTLHDDRWYLMEPPFA